MFALTGVSKSKDFPNLTDFQLKRSLNFNKERIFCERGNFKWKKIKSNGMVSY